MKLYKQISTLVPISSEERLNEVMEILKGRNTLINAQLEAYLYSNTSEELHLLMKEKIGLYNQEYKPIVNPSGKGHKSRKKRSSGSNKRFGISEDSPIRSQMFAMRSSQYGTPPSKRGFIYGLSDW